MFRKTLLYSALMLSMLTGTSCGKVDPGRVLRGAGTYEGNLHTHTIASDGENTYHEMVDGAVEEGLDFLVITDHHKISAAARFYCPRERRLLCVLGEEINTLEGHMLAVGIKEAVPGGLSAQETIDSIHLQGGLAIAAHLNEPHGYGINQTDLEKLVGLDAVEYTPIDKQDWYGNIDFLPGYPAVFDSDAHSTNMLRNVANSCALEELSIDGLRQAIKDGKCEVYFP